MKSYRFIIQRADGTLYEFTHDGESQKDARAYVPAIDGEKVIAWAEIKERKHRTGKTCKARYAWVELDDSGNPVLRDETFTVSGTSGDGKNGDMLIRRAMHNAGKDIAPGAVFVGLVTD